ncbi:hypothetical protein BGX24_010391 [Mortierella sp. AD032]|nr:hypothetical protein BGX24_010391 [Mortierella sp. AD032]
MISSEPPPTQGDRLKTIEEELAKSVKLLTTTALHRRNHSTTKDQDEDTNNSITHLLSIPKLDKVQNERMSTKSALCDSERFKTTVKDRRTRDILTKGTYTGMTASQQRFFQSAASAPTPSHSSLMDTASYTIRRLIPLAITIQPTSASSRTPSRSSLIYMSMQGLELLHY